MKQLNEYSHLFFDMDNTVTRSRTPIETEMKTLLSSLSQDVIVISGQAAANIKNQLDGVPAYIMGQNGNQAFNEASEELWNDILTPKQVSDILHHIATITEHIDIAVSDPNDLIEHRGAQLCYSFIGHHEDINKKEVFDPSKEIRQALLKDHPFTSDTVEVKIGGTTTLDYFSKGKHKGTNVARLIDEKGWDKNDCVYVGDGLFPGGNDEAVLGVIETLAVANPHETYEHLKKAFG